MPLYKNLIIIILLLVSSLVTGQTEETLLNKLNDAPKQEYASLYNQLSKVTLKSNPNQSLKYAEQSIQLSTDNPKELSLAYINSGKAATSLKKHKEAIVSFEKAITVYNQNNIKLGTAYGNLLIGRSYIKLNKNKKAIPYLKSAYTVNNTSNSYLNAAYAAHDLVEVYGDRKDIDNTTKWFNNSIRSYEKAKNSKQVTKVTFLYGAYLADYGDYKNAKIQLEEALKQATKDKRLTAEIKQVLATIEHNRGVEKESISNHQISQQIETEEYIESIEQQKVLTLAEIDKLSEEKQLIELKLKIDRDNFEKEILIKQHTLEQQKKNIVIKDANIETQKAKIKQHKTEERNRTLQLIGAIISLILITIIALISFKSYRNKKKAYKDLNIKNKKIEIQKEEIEYKSKNIEKSIQYAQKIQLSLLPTEKTIHSAYPSSFVFFQPKDHVSGDFIWTYTQGEKSILVVADCTGHGVPGAFMSIVCANLLERVIAEEKITRPDLILSEIDNRLKQSINKYEEHGIKDGMDVALVLIEGNDLSYAGARNPLYIVSSGNLITLKGDRKSIGYGNSMVENKKFTLQNYTIKTGDTFYLSTDGYVDQRGGIHNTKFYAKPFRELLIDINKMPFINQKETITETFNNWKGNEEQMDDVTVLGFRV